MRAVDCELATGPAASRQGTRTGPTDRARLDLQPLDAAGSPEADVDAQRLAEWVRHYLMRPHPDLGRAGHVCPFTARSARLALLRIGISPCDGAERHAILRTMADAMRAFDALPSTRSTRIYRTVIVGFPRCSDAAGLAALRQVQNAMRHHSVVLAKMIGLFEPESGVPGLINPAFRPLRSPMPVLAIRMLVEQDAPFVVRNPLVAPVYLLRYPLAGPRRLFDEAHARWRRARTGRRLAG